MIGKPLSPCERCVPEFIRPPNILLPRDFDRRFQIEGKKREALKWEWNLYWRSGFLPSINFFSRSSKVFTAFFLTSQFAGGVIDYQDSSEEDGLDPRFDSGYRPPIKKRG